CAMTGRPIRSPKPIGMSCGDYPGHPCMGLVDGRRLPAPVGLPNPNSGRSSEWIGRVCDLVLGGGETRRVGPAPVGHCSGAVAHLAAWASPELAYAGAKWCAHGLLPRVQLLPLTPEVAVGSTRLPGAFHRDPADQLIVATARHYDCPLVTLDQLIRAYPPGPTRHRFSKIPSPRRISSRKLGSRAAAKRFLAMLSLDG